MALIIYPLSQVPQFFDRPSSLVRHVHSTSAFAVRPKISRSQITCSLSPASSHMDSQDEGHRKFLEFPYALAPVRNLMVDLVSMVENLLDSQLLPCTLPSDVQYYENETGTAQASLHIRSGVNTSPIDFILGSWVHAELPSGGSLNITSLSAYLNSKTDAPNFLIELIQSSPTSLILILDLPPRKDLVVYPEYLNTFYETTKLDTHKQVLEKLPEIKPYFSSALYIRCVVSPTAIMVKIEAGKSSRMEEIVGSEVHSVAKEVMRFWLDKCVGEQREVGEMEKAYLVKRDGVIKRKTIEIDLGSSFPRLFGSEVAGRVLREIEKYFTE